jgi:predicted RNA-binding protein with PUA-like domain
MGIFLLKTEPSTYSFADLERDGKATWDGVANPLAQKHIRSARSGDRAVVYHTGDERRAVGVATIVSDPYADPADGRLAVFDLVPERPLAVPVPLDALRSAEAFKDSPLLKLGRLSVVPLSDAQWKALLALARTTV